MIFLLKKSVSYSRSKNCDVFFFRIVYFFGVSLSTPLHTLYIKYCVFWSTINKIIRLSVSKLHLPCYSFLSLQSNRLTFLGSLQRNFWLVLAMSDQKHNRVKVD